MEGTIHLILLYLFEKSTIGDLKQNCFLFNSMQVSRLISFTIYIWLKFTQQHTLAHKK